MESNAEDQGFNIDEKKELFLILKDIIIDTMELPKDLKLFDNNYSSMPTYGVGFGLGSHKIGLFYLDSNGNYALGAGERKGWKTELEFSHHYNLPNPYNLTRYRS